MDNGRSLACNENLALSILYLYIYIHVSSTDIIFFQKFGLIADFIQEFLLFRNWNNYCCHSFHAKNPKNLLTMNQILYRRLIVILRSCCQLFSTKTLLFTPTFKTNISNALYHFYTKFNANLLIIFFSKIRNSLAYAIKRNYIFKMAANASLC